MNNEKWDTFFILHSSFFIQLVLHRHFQRLDAGVSADADHIVAVGEIFCIQLDALRLNVVEVLLLHHSACYVKHANLYR